MQLRGTVKLCELRHFLAIGPWEVPSPLHAFISSTGKMGKITRPTPQGFVRIKGDSICKLLCKSQCAIEMLVMIIINEPL